MAKHTLGTSHSISLADDRKLHYRQQGSGSPTVVFESGMGFSSALWGLIQPDIAAVTAAVVYDRAGTGKSDRDSQDRSLDRVVDDLEELLNRLQGPFILVGFSWGGPIVRRLAARRTADVRGMVLIDQTDERDSQYRTRVRQQPSGLLRTAVMWLKHTIGLWSAIRVTLTTMPTDCRRELVFRDALWRGVRAYEAELSHFIPGLIQLKDDADRLEGIDVTVVSGTDPEGMKDEYRPTLVQAHRETASALDRGTFVEATQSAHYIPFSEPELAVQEILKLVEKVREASWARYRP